jgi:selenide,water dikinase
VGFDDLDDAGVFSMGDGLALVQTMDFFTPIVDDPNAYGQIAAANALSDVYAMGAKPLTAMNIACFDPTSAEPDVWAGIFQGMSQKCEEAEVAVVGGHTVEDSQPKFGLSVTGVVQTARMMTTAGAQAGDKIYLSKPLGTGIITTAAKFDACPNAVLETATETMAALNKTASEAAVAVGAKAATDITGFGLAGHCYNVARASKVTIRIDSLSLPIIAGVRDLAAQGHTTAGASKTLSFIGNDISFEIESQSEREFYSRLVTDPQTSGGLAIFTRHDMPGYNLIGEVVEGKPLVEII